MQIKYYFDYICNFYSYYYLYEMYNCNLQKEDWKDNQCERKEFNNIKIQV